MSNDKILKSLNEGLEELKDLFKSKLEKGRKPLPTGTVRNWHGKDYKKVSEGKWEEVKKPGSVDSKEKEEKKTGKKEAYSDLTAEQRAKVKEAKPSSQEDINEADVVITFETPEEMNLWENEISGQISDGQWENTRGTKWIWGAAYKLGPETKVETTSFHNVGKKSFPLNSELKDIVGKRAMEEAGFKDMSSMSDAWKKINNAIKNVSYSEKLRENKDKTDKEKRTNKENKVKEFLSEIEKKGFDNKYSFASEKPLGKISDREVKLEIDPSSLSDSGKVETKINFYGGNINPFDKKVSIHKDKIEQYGKMALEFLKQINS